MTHDIKALKARYFSYREFSGYGELYLHWEEHGPLPKNGWRLPIAGFRRLSAFAFDSCQEEHFIPV